MDIPPMIGSGQEVPCAQRILDLTRPGWSPVGITASGDTGSDSRKWTWLADSRDYVCAVGSIRRRSLLSRCGRAVVTSLHRHNEEQVARQCLWAL